jgi:ABC-type Zn uptake system ZnuABC Zn-binding protein ZnuA
MPSSRSRGAFRALLLALPVVAACSRAPRSGEPAPRVAAATIAPLADVLARIAGPSWDVRTLVPPGTSPHVFEPTPREVRLVAPARLLVTVGAGYDGWAAQLAAACAPRAALFDAGAAAGVEAPSGAALHAHEDGETDPHWWLDPGLVERSLGPLAEKLAAVDPAGADGYRRRAAAFGAELTALDEEIGASLAPVRGAGILSAHDAWPRFAARYGLRTVGSIEPVPGREPSPRDLAALVKTARREGIRTLFTEPQFPPSAARVVADEAGIRVATADPIGGVPGRSGYAELMRWNARVFREGLSPR